MQKLGFSGVVLGLLMATGPQADAAMLLPGGAFRAVPAAARGIEQASFWARPFPSGYSGWRHCRRQRVLVETPYGPKWRRVCI